MNVLWTKGKFRKIFSTENLNNVNLHASGDAAAAGRCCRLCGGDSSLRSLGDTYVWEGVVERYDQLLYDCFGVRVTTSDCLICEWCVRQLRNTERFMALVYAAFDKPPSSTIPSPTHEPEISDDLIDNENVGIIDNKVIIELLKTNMTSDNKKKLRRRVEKPSEVKRANIQCKNCKQKYIMLVTGGSKEFVCSRCKKIIDKSGRKRRNPTVQGGGKEHIGMHSKTDSRGKIRQTSLLKKPSQTKRQESLPRVRLAKFKCTICPKKYATSDHLVEHMKLIHGERSKTACVLCGKSFRTKDLLDKHIQMHIDMKHYNNVVYGSTKLKHASKMHVAREKRSV